MDIRPNFSENSPSYIERPSSNFIDNSDEGTRYTQPCSMHDNLSETKALENRSVIETKIITDDELKNLILEQNFSNNVHYRVEGELNISWYTGLTALPENLSVTGNLDLRGCTGLTALPEHLSVGGYLDLKGCTGLTALPEHLSVEGDLRLSDCTGLTALPNWSTTLGETTEGNTRNVYLQNTGLSDTLIDSLREVEPPGMQFHFSRSAGQPERQFSNVVEGLTFWRQLASADSEIPELSLMHDQAIDLVRYLERLTSTADYQNQATRPVLAQRVMAITALLTGSDRIRDEAMDHIYHALTSCDDRIILALDDLDTMHVHYRVEGEHNISFSTGLTALPENLSVRGDLDLEGCTGLTALPEHLSVGGYLDLKGCTGLTALPEHLSVGGYLNLEGCTGLTALPEHLSVGRYLNLSGCTGLTALPENLSVTGTLRLSGCTGLTALPENLSVTGTLRLSGCTGLTALPENLSVTGYLDLEGCTGLTALPENLYVGGDLNLSDCTGLTALPNWITTLGETTEGNTRNVYLQNTGLSDTLIDRLLVVESPRMQFHFSRSTGQPEQQFSNVVEGLTFWRKLASADSEIPELSLMHNQATDLVRYLGRLTSTADYENQATRPVLAQRVMAITALLTGSDRIRNEAMDHIHHALTSCDDRIILALDDLDTMQLLDSAERKAFAGNADELRELGLQMMRLDEVKRIARDHMKTLIWVDEIEVELAFQIGVRQQLALPGSTQHMIFRRCANVSDQDIANAVNQVNTHCSDDNLQAYLAQWDPWQKYLRRQEVPTFDQLPQKTVDRIEDCAISAEKTPKMVALGNDHLDYDALVRAVVEYGKNPLTNSPMDWSNVFRLTEEDSPSSLKRIKLNDP